MTGKRFLTAFGRFAGILVWLRQTTMLIRLQTHFGGSSWIISSPWKRLINKSVKNGARRPAWMMQAHSPIVVPYCSGSTSRCSSNSCRLPLVPCFSYNRSLSVISRSWRSRRSSHTRLGPHPCHPNWNLLQINLAERWLNWITTTWQSLSKLHTSFGEIHFVPLSHDIEPLGQSPEGFREIKKSATVESINEIESKQRNWIQDPWPRVH